jgi:EmrB/QacA subfamily drug resistance transporter
MMPMDGEIKQEGRNLRLAGRADSDNGTSGASSGGNGATGWWLIPVLVALIGAFMSLLDTSIVNVAIAKIMSVFGTNTSTVEWVVTIYMLVMGAVVSLSGWLGDKLGLKRLYILSMAVFIAGSALCAMTWSINALIVARALQALGGGMIMPTTMAMVSRMVPKERIGEAMGILGVALVVAPAIGPTLGGYLVEYVDWRWIFTINLPIGVIGVLLSLFLLPELQTGEAGRLDIGGALTSSAGLFCLLLALSKGADWGWHSEAITLLFYTSAVCILLFIYLELTAANPLLDLRVYRYSVFALSSLLVVITIIGMYAVMYYLPLFLQTIRGLGAMETGLLMMPGALMSGLMMPIIGVLYDRIGPRLLSAVGVLALFGIIFAFHNLNMSTSYATIITWLVMEGVAMTMAMMPSMTAALAVLPAELASRGSAVINILRLISSSFGITVLTYMLNTRIAVHSQQMVNNFTPWSLALNDFYQKTAAFLSGGVSGSQLRMLGSAYLEGIVAQSAFVKALDDVFVIAAAITLFGVVPALFLKRVQGSGGRMIGE